MNSAAYNANNQLTSWAGTTHSYDLNGNLTGDGTKTFTWNARDQLTALSGGVTASFSYDGAGRRKSKTVAGTQTGFLYDGLNFVQELTGTTPKANLITGGIDELFLRKETSATRHPLTDALGSVFALTDAAGAMSTEYTFEPYGSTTTSGAADTNSQSYTGREHDGTGLFYTRARYIHPGTGRFISEDPLGWESGQANNFVYVGNDPINFADPLGLLRLPNNPSGLPPEWVPDPSHRHPNGERWRHPGGDYLDFHPGREGKGRHQGRDHWHHNDGDDHLYPGDEVPDPPCEDDSAKKMFTAVGLGVGAYGLYRLIRFVPSIAPPLWWTIPFNVATP